MEYLNRIQIKGVVGSVRLNEYNGIKVISFSVCTEHLHKSSNGSPVCETEWHNVVCWQSDTSESLENIVKGSKVYVEGRVRSSMYTSVSGEEKIYKEIIASRLDRLKGE